MRLLHKDQPGHCWACGLLNYQSWTWFCSWPSGLWFMRCGYWSEIDDDDIGLTNSPPHITLLNYVSAALFDEPTHKSFIDENKTTYCTKPWHSRWIHLFWLLISITGLLLALSNIVKENPIKSLVPQMYNYIRIQPISCWWKIRWVNFTEWGLKKIHYNLRVNM